MSKTSGVVVGIVLASTCLVTGLKPGSDAALARELFDVVLESKGYVVPIAPVQVTPRVSGQLVEVFIEEGSKVEKDAVLARIDATPFELDTKRAQALLAAARARLEELQAGSREEEKVQADAAVRQAEEQLKLSRKELDRLRQLQTNAAVGADVVSKAEARAREVELEVLKLRAASKVVREGPRKERLELVKAEVAVAEAELAKAKWLLDGTQIRAPIGGTILSKIAEKGNVIDPKSFQGKGSLCDMADLTRLEVELTVQERDLRKVFKGQKCKILLEAFPETTYNGEVSRVLPVADRAKGAVPVRVRITVPKDDTQLRPEMGAIVTFLGNT